MSESVMETKPEVDDRPKAQAPVFNIVRHSTLCDGGHPNQSVTLVQANLAFLDAAAEYLGSVEGDEDDPQHRVMQTFARRCEAQARFIRGQYAQRMAARATSDSE